MTLTQPISLEETSCKVDVQIFKCAKRGAGFGQPLFYFLQTVLSSHRRRQLLKCYTKTTMDNLDFIHRKETAASDERLAIPVHIALAIQQEVILKMVPQAVQERIAAGQTELLDKFAERFMEKYVVERNGLDEFCADPITDRDVLKRFTVGTYTDLDIETLRGYLEKKGKLFESESDTEDFLRQNLH